VADLPIPELVENQRRSIAMLAPGAWALSRDEALELVSQLRAGRPAKCDGCDSGVQRIDLDAS
jgi:hypothetical protein